MLGISFVAIFHLLIKMVKALLCFKKNKTLNFSDNPLLKSSARTNWLLISVTRLKQELVKEVPFVMISYNLQ